MLATAAQRGAKRAKRLPTSRALHTASMGEVAARLRPRLDAVAWCEPTSPFMGRPEVGALRTAAEIRDFLADFLVLPVYWDATVRALREGWGRDFVEVGPGNVLSGMMPFIDTTAAIQSASDILERQARL